MNLSCLHAPGHCLLLGQQDWKKEWRVRGRNGSMKLGLISITHSALSKFQCHFSFALLVSLSFPSPSTLSAFISLSLSPHTNYSLDIGHGPMISLIPRGNYSSQEISKKDRGGRSELVVRLSVSPLTANYPNLTC